MASGTLTEAFGVSSEMQLAVPGLWIHNQDYEY